MYSLYTKKLWAPPRLIAKLLLIMRLTTIILFIAIIQVSASTYAQRITLSEKNASLVKVFDQISLQSGFDFFVSKALLKNANPVNIKVRNADLETVLKQIFENQPLEFSIQEKAVVVKQKDRSFLDNIITAFNAIDIHGRVLDEEGKPLAGATLSIVRLEAKGLEDNKAGDFSLSYKGRNAAAVTDGNGEFTLKNVDESSMIIVSYTGYVVYRAKVAKEMETIKMVLDGNLQEVNVTVNTGYQSIARERSAGAIAKPDMDILKNRSGSMNIIQRLDGLVPGLTLNNSPSPTGNLKGGTRGTSVLIRGLTTISESTNRDPLYVVNGIPVTDISTLNPNDIEDVTILKDATSASIWGAKAANGVIVITTKKGTKTGKLKINYDGFINFQGKPDLANQNTLNSSQYIEAAKEIFDPVVNPWGSVSVPKFGGLAPVSPHELILYNKSRSLITQVQADEQLNALASQNNLQQIEDLWYRNAALMNHSLSLSGGSDKYSFYGSGSYTSTKDNRPGSNNDNYSLNLRQDFKFNDRIKMYIVTDLFNNARSSKNTGSRPDATFLPYAMFQNPDGSNADMSWLYRIDEVRTGYENKSLVSLKYNPLDEINTGSTRNNLIKAAVTSGVSINLLKGFRYEGVFGYSRTQNKTINYLTQDNYTVRSELASFTLAATTVGGQPTYLLPNIGGRNTVTNALNKDWTVRNQFVYDNNWNDRKHQVTFLVGQEASEQFFNSNGSVVRGYNPQLMSYGIVDYAKLGAGVTKTVMPTGTSSSLLDADYYRESETTARVTSYYANGGYTYAGKYTFNAGIRIDESNLFGKDKSAQNRPVWSAGVAWQAGKEDFMQNVNWINKLVLRGSYGITGNSPDPGVAASKDIFIAQMLLFYPGGAGLNLSSPANRALTWETTKNMNIGIDFSLLQNRLSGTIDIYHKNTENLIGSMVLNPFTSFPSTIGNAGDMTNQGVDLNISSVNLTHGDLRWNTLLTLGFNKNKITSLNRLTPIVVGSDKISQAYVEGYSAFSLFAYTYSGLDAMGDPQIKLADGTITKNPNSDKPDDVKYMGTFQPKWSGGFSNIFGFKDFSLSVNAVYNLGYVMRRDVNRLYTGRDGFFANADFGGNPNVEFANRWKKPGDEATTNVPGYLSSASQRRNTDYYRYADINVLDASYIKLRDITLSYSLPKVLTKKIKADIVTFRAQLSNVMLWKANHAGIDPEFSNALFGTRSPLSNQHTITFGAHITF